MTVLIAPRSVSFALDRERLLDNGVLLSNLP